jgi:hypothetical protein
MGAINCKPTTYNILLSFISHVHLYYPRAYVFEWKEDPSEKILLVIFFLHKSKRETGHP